MSPHSEEVRIPTGDAILAGTLLVPHGRGPHPGLLLVTGSGANDRDETVCGHAPFRIIAEYFAGCGYAVLRRDDRGVGGSTGDPGAQDFEGTVGDVVATYRWLAARQEVDAERVTLLGHSEGGLIAAVAAPRVRAAAVVMLAGPSVRIEALLHEQARAISAEAGATAAQIEHERRMNERVFSLARSDQAQAEVQVELEGVIRAYLQSWPDAEAFDETAVVEATRVMAGVVSAPAYRSFLRQQPAEILRRTGAPMLAVFGGKDTQVPGGPNAQAFREITAGLPSTRSRLFPDHNHLFQRAGTGAISEYESLTAGPDDTVLHAVADWLATAQNAATADRGAR